jgi:hypothetical protein
MKPGDHPDFFRLPPPAGRSRESTIVLDKQGRFFHDGERVEHAGLASGFARWVRRHPDDGRFILSNGYDWCYFTVEDTAFFVMRIREEKGELVATLSDGSEAPLPLEGLWIDSQGVLRAHVKAAAFEARFTQSAQLQVAPWLVDGEPISLEVGGRRVAIATAAPDAR